MKRIIDRKVYDTETATLIHEWDNGGYSTDFSSCEESLYRTRKGAFFIAGSGGPMSVYAESHGNTTSGGGDLRVISKDAAIEWLETHDGTDALETYFVEDLEEA